MTVVINGTSGITDVNGTAAAPAITGTDTDTGVFFGTNTVSLSTGGTERVTLDASGNLSVGLTSTGGARFAVQGSSTSGYLTVGDGTSTMLVGAGAALSSDSATPYLRSNGAIGFASGGGSERMRLDANGNLGIGTSTPSTYAGANGQLVIYGGVNTTFTNNPNNITLINNGTIAAGLGTGINFGANYNGSISTTYALISGIRENATSGSPAGALVFGTRDSAGSVTTERARIDSSGNLLVGTTSFALSNSNNVMLNASSGVVYAQHANGTSSGVGYAGFSYNGSTIGSITQNGTTGVLYNLTSDYRLKNNPTPVTGAKEFVMALQPKTWDWWDGSGKGVGFIAHEFMEVAKYSGNGEKDAVDENGNPVYQSIQPSSSEVMANLVALLQEQQAIITQLQADVAALKAKA